MLDLLAYHRDAEVADVVLAAKLVAGVVLAALALGLALLLPGSERGRNRAARLAALVAGVGLLAYAAFKVLPGGDSSLVSIAWGVTWITLLLAAVVGPACGIAGAVRAADRGERRLAIAALVASLLVPAIVIANVTACVVTDGCFH